MDMIANIASVVTCVSFSLYLAGRIWIAIKNICTSYERFAVLPFDCDMENEDNILIVDDNGHRFSLESPYGINNLWIYKVDYEINQDGTLKQRSADIVSTYSKLNKDKLFIQCDLGEILSTTRFKVERSDYAVVTFDVYVSGKNGHVMTSNHIHKTTIKSFLYYLCV